MTDIFERLRHAEGNKALEIGEAWNLLGEAVEEIERLHGVILRRDQQIIRLQAALQKIADMDKHSGASKRQRAASELARKALAEN